MMKADLIVYFDYDNKPDGDKEQEVADLGSVRKVGDLTILSFLLSL